MANNTIYPYGPGGQLPSGIPIVNDLVTGGANKALAAEQGKVLRERILLADTVFWRNSSSAAWITGNIYRGVIEDTYANKYIIITNFPEGVTQIKINRVAPDSTYNLSVYGSSDGTNFTTLASFGTSSGTKTYTLGSYDRIALLLWDKPSTDRAKQEGITVTYPTESEVINEADVVDALNSQATNLPLSAKQGYVLDGKIGNIIGGGEYELSWVTGDINNRGNLNTSYANKSTGFIYLKTNTITIHNRTGYNVKIACYNSSQTYLGATTGVGPSVDADRTVLQNTAYVRLCAWDKPSDSDVLGISATYLLDSSSPSLMSLQTQMDEMYADKYYSNPVLSQNCADPCIVDGQDGYFYMFYTGTLGTAAMRRTPDFIHWETADSPITQQAVSDCLTDLGLTSAPTMWAPEIVKVGDKYNLYMSKTSNPMVVFQSDHPFFGYEYKGKIITTTNGLSDDNIDACVRYDLDGTLWIYWGSTYGMYRQKLSADGLTLDTTDTKEHVAGKLVSQDSSRATVFEGAYLYRRRGYWYLFVSAGWYGNYTYCIKVGRCATLDGTFVDQDGNNMTDGYATTILSSASGDTLYGPGHNGQIITDRNNRTYMIYHSHYTQASQSSYRYICLQEILWDSTTGWPYFANSGKPQLGLNIKPEL